MATMCHLTYLAMCARHVILSSIRDPLLLLQNQPSTTFHTNTPPQDVCEYYQHASCWVNDEIVLDVKRLWTGLQFCELICTYTGSITACTFSRMKWSPFHCV